MNTGNFHKLLALLLATTGITLLQLLPVETSGQETVEEITMTLGDYRFSPDSIEVRSGTPVILTLINKDSITPHNFTLKDESGGLDIDTKVRAGSKVVVKFTPAIPGTYTFYCNKKLPFVKSHRARGMEGTLSVKD
ncbi:MAG: cupredoxin domain-containing protein [Gammaproteobacteria bacterium]